MPLRVREVDHIVVNVADAEKSLAFYRDELGLEAVRVEEWRRGDAPFPSVRINEGAIIDLFELSRSGENVNHFCLTVDPTDFEQIKASGRIEVLEGPVPRFGARGEGTSLYVRDPDGNTIELRYYGTWGA
jgi:catechol 2,3-dioxygenase-like lactoylglutathione lyase family enzyme